MKIINIIYVIYSIKKSLIYHLNDIESKLRLDLLLTSFYFFGKIFQNLKV